MRYSLISRFQGVMLGAAIGEELGSYRAVQYPSDAAIQAPALIPNSNLHRWQPNLQLKASLQPSRSSIYGQTAVYWTKVLLDSGTWRELQDDLLPDSQTKPEESAESGASLFRNGAELAIAALPLMLFFHDNEVRLTQVLEEIVVQLKMPRSTLAELTVIQTAIAQALTEQLTPNLFVHQLVGKLQEHNWGNQSKLTELISSLQLVQSLLHTGSDLGTVTRKLAASKVPTSGIEIINLALYCFLSTPDDVRLTLVRAAQINHLPQVVCGLAGALSGAYNSLNGIPLSWHWEAKADSQTLVWGVTSATLRHLSARLLAAWSGVYDLNSLPDYTPAVAKAGMIRLR